MEINLKSLDLLSWIAFKLPGYQEHVHNRFSIFDLLSLSVAFVNISAFLNKMYGACLTDVQPILFLPPQMFHSKI